MHLTYFCLDFLIWSVPKMLHYWIIIIMLFVMLCIKYTDIDIFSYNKSAVNEDNMRLELKADLTVLVEIFKVWSNPLKQTQKRKQEKKEILFSCHFWSTVEFGFLFSPHGIISNCFPFFFCLAHKSNLPVLHEKELLLCSKRRQRALVHIYPQTHTHTHKHRHRPTSLASTCRLCGTEIRLHQIHNAVLISMPTNLTQSKKVTLCRNQKRGLFVSELHAG